MRLRIIPHALGGLLALTITASAVAGGSTLHVDDDAAPGGDGTTWKTAYQFLQDALATAFAGGVDEIRIAGGSYLPDRSAAVPNGTASRDATFLLVPDVAHRGGFAGVGAPDPDARDTALYASVLTGDLAGNDGAGFAGNEENSNHIVTTFVGDITLDGVTIRGGNVGGMDGRGSGLLHEGGRLTLVGSTFESNASTNGGAAYFLAAAEVSDCTFDGNRGVQGGAVVVHSDVDVNRCVFTRNKGGGSGGAIKVIAGDCRIQDSIFTDNELEDLGGGIAALSPVEVVNCLFAGNTAGRSGGGIYARDGLTVRNCTFHRNAGNHLGGGAIQVDEGFPESTVENCVMWENTSTAGPDEIFAPGGIEVRYCTVQGDWPGEGNKDADPSFVPGPGGVWTTSATYDAVLDQTTFTDAAAAFDSLFARLLVPNTVIDAFHAAIVSSTATTLTISGDLSPLGFAGASYEILDHHLASGSPAIDAGDNAAVPKGTTGDLDGNPRFVDDPDTPDTGSGEPPLVDMGAYEFQHDACPADLDESGAVDFGDILAVLGAWGSAGGPEDLDGSGTVAFGDLLIVLGAWGPCP